VGTSESTSVASNPESFRDWTLDVLNIVRRLVESRRRGDESLAGESEIDQSLLTSSPTGEFKTADVYAFERELEKLHPDNPVNNRVTRGRPPRPRHFSRLGNSERNLAESKGPRGPSERERASPNPPATPNPRRCRIIDSSRSWRMEIAVMSPAWYQALGCRHVDRDKRKNQSNRNAADQKHEEHHEKQVQKA